MGVYDSLAATAKRLIDKYGQSGTLRRFVLSPVDPATPWVTVEPPTNVDTAVTVVREATDDPNEEKAYAAATTAPVDGDLLLLGGATFAVSKVVALNPGGTVVMYEMRIRPWPQP